ncbi:Fe-S cluster assembly sulfur transfer protein SufU [Sneathiella sp.]|jgi:nitrogen fixation NifU-like protein|uniref:Fe-S cluster assembly sulfur transfer protein SufU n=1 Tax=Sneathiella sp. TaxID=1964365 RepID=UPI0039E3C7E4
MSDSLKELYQEVILDHSKHPRNFGKPEHFSHEAHGYNPLCGDTVNVYMTLDEQDIIQDVSFDGKGCAISLASASLMTEILKGKTKREALSLFDQFHKLVAADGTDLDAGEDTERLMVLAGVKQFPMRVKCATLSWHAMNSAFKGAAETTTE